ncbi:anti-sigma factor antagonist [Armatimonadota bacterium]|nr:anti-sigma factor antagonist [Armatimonadota bacterium]
METLEHETRTNDGVTIIKLLGDKLNAANSKAFRDSLLPIISQGGKFVIDLQSLTFMDSSGVGALLSCLRQVNEQGGDVRLCGVQKPVKVLFQLIRMSRVFDICDSVKEAEASYNA